jgi:hypothetical protein
MEKVVWGLIITTNLNKKNKSVGQDPPLIEQS